MKVICPVCTSVESKDIGFPKTNPISDSLIKHNYKIVKCSNCKLYYVSPLIDFNYSQWSELYNSDYFVNQTSWSVKKRKQELIKRFDTAESLITTKNSVKKFLDIGTGEGKALIEAHKRGWEATGIDIVDNRIPQAQIPEIQFIKANLLDSDLLENYFDFIYVDSVLEHVLNPLDYLVRIKKLINKNGCIYIGVPNEDCLYNDVRKFLFLLSGKSELSAKIKPFFSPYHVVGFNKYSLQYLLNKVELHIKILRNFGRKLEFLSYSPKTKAFWFNLLFLFPIEYLGNIIKRDVYFEAYLSKTL